MTYTTTTAAAAAEKIYTKYHVPVARYDEEEEETGNYLNLGFP